MLFADAAPLLQAGQTTGGPASHAAYFEWLHSVLPTPLFHTQAFLVFFLIVAMLVMTVWQPDWMLHLSRP